MCRAQAAALLKPAKLVAGWLPSLLPFLPFFGHELVYPMFVLAGTAEELVPASFNVSNVCWPIVEKPRQQSGC